jgi:hypothetical protein
MNALAKVATYAKAVAAGLSAGGTALGVAVADGGLSTGDVVSVVLAVLGALGVVYVVPNKDAAADSLEHGK